MHFPNLIQPRPAVPLLNISSHTLDQSVDSIASSIAKSMENHGQKSDIFINKFKEIHQFIVQTGHSYFQPSKMYKITRAVYY